MVRTVWNFARTIIFYLLGLMNTLFIRPEDAGTLKNYIGYIFLILAILSLRQEYFWVLSILSLLSFFGDINENKIAGDFFRQL